MTNTPDDLGKGAQAELLARRQEQIVNGTAAAKIAEAVGRELGSQAENKGGRESK